jgi:intracellular sulfur oxidation DsrE/DsrF family protein
MTVCKVLIHISDREKWRSVLSQVSRLTEASDVDSLQITILADAFAGAVCIACDRLLRQRMEVCVKEGHRILACEDSLRSLNMKPENLPDFIQSVPNGVKEIIQLQDEGCHYIKA